MKKKILVYLTIAGIFFVYGLSVGVYKIFPYAQLKNIVKGDPFLSSKNPDKKIVYKSTSQGNLKLHIFHPKNYVINSEFSTVIFFFGGGWKYGTPKQFYPQCEYLSKKGMLCVSAEYRISSIHHTSPQHAVEDAKSAIRFLRQHAQELKINTNKIVAGGSAGAHIAAGTAMLSSMKI